MDGSELVEVRPGVRSGKRCFTGTRITVDDVLEYLASGMTHEQIVEDFPELTEAHIRAALELGATPASRANVLPVSDLPGRVDGFGSDTGG